MRRRRASTVRLRRGRSSTVGLWGRWPSTTVLGRHWCTVTGSSTWSKNHRLLAIGWVLIRAGWIGISRVAVTISRPWRRGGGIHAVCFAISRRRWGLLIRVLLARISLSLIHIRPSCLLLFLVFFLLFLLGFMVLAPIRNSNLVLFPLFLFFLDKGPLLLNRGTPPHFSQKPGYFRILQGWIGILNLTPASLAVV